MNESAILVEDLSKRYRVGVIGGKTLREDLQRWWALLRGKPDPLVKIGRCEGLNGNRNTRKADSKRCHSSSDDYVWALRDVSLEVKKGEILGIIGRNGAGKSTLLKILTRITAPTSGEAFLKGRVGALLEVGTGFHQELTGMENIFLSGAILGMTKADVQAKLDEIVEFSGCGRYIDTPVKRYSSGMRVRLGFAVAAHLDPEILLIDEVLAVGDIEFQKKCLGKMGGVAGQGRTVLFVSHNMASIRELCTRVICLNEGGVFADGHPEDVVDEYLTMVESDFSKLSLYRREDREGGQILRFSYVNFINPETGKQIETLLSGQRVDMEVGYVNLGPETINGVTVGIVFFTKSGYHLFACRSDFIGKRFDILPGEGSLKCSVEKWPLSNGRYSYNVLAYRRGTAVILDWIKRAGYVDVEAGDFYGTGKFPTHFHQGVFVEYEWEPKTPSIVEGVKNYSFT